MNKRNNNRNPKRMKAHRNREVKCLAHVPYYAPLASMKPSKKYFESARSAQSSITYSEVDGKKIADDTLDRGIVSLALTTIIQDGEMPIDALSEPTVKYYDYVEFDLHRAVSTSYIYDLCYEISTKITSVAGVNYKGFKNWKWDAKKVNAFWHIYRYLLNAYKLDNGLRPTNLALGYFGKTIINAVSEHVRKLTTSLGGDYFVGVQCTELAVLESRFIRYANSNNWQKALKLAEAILCI